MHTKITNFHELSKLLSVKNNVEEDIMTYFVHFGLGHLLHRLSLEKQGGISAVQLILSLCLFRINGESIHSIYKKSFYDLLDTGKNCYYRMMSRSSMDWRRLLLGIGMRFESIVRREKAEAEHSSTCFIIDDTTLEKLGMAMERISKVFDHVAGRCVLGYKLLLLAYFDGKSTLPIDFSLHREKGRKGDYGLKASDRRKQFCKCRDKDAPDCRRLQESDMEKPAVAIEMLRRAWKYGYRARYVLCDSWFTSEKLIAAVRSIGNGAMHLAGLARMGNTKYQVMGRRHNALELVALYERSEFFHECRKYKCHYISLKGKIGKQSVRIFLVKYGRNTTWNILLTTDLNSSFVQTFEIYQIRWNIEIVNKECKQYLGLGGYQGRDFDGQIADCTLCFMTYTVMTLKKRFSDYETLGELFSAERDGLMALTLWKRILACLERFLQALADVMGLDADRLIEGMMEDKELAQEYKVMADAIEKYRMQKAA